MPWARAVVAEKLCAALRSDTVIVDNRAGGVGADRHRAFIRDRTGYTLVSGHTGIDLH